jgi:hypothetical protein
VAICVVFVDSSAVGAKGTPVSVADFDITTFSVPLTGLETSPLLSSVNTGNEGSNVWSIGWAANVAPPLLQCTAIEALVIICVI